VSRLGRADTVRSVTAESELAGFIAKFAPEMQCRIRGCRAKLQARFPDAVQMVYDNYNFLVIGFGPTGRACDAILSLDAHARGVNLCFLQRGPKLPDPTSILRGSGKVVRTVALDSPDDLDRPDVGALIEAGWDLPQRRWMPRTTQIWSSRRCRPSSVPAADAPPSVREASHAPSRRRFLLRGAPSGKLRRYARLTA
jgi:hypothetical protein